MKYRTKSIDTSSIEKKNSIKYHDPPDHSSLPPLASLHAESRQNTCSSAIEVDYDLNPTELYINICESAWEQALAALEKNPDESRTWVVKRDPCGDDDEEDSSVRFLPLHSACARQPPLEIIISLLTIYPKASSIIDDNGMYPLHYACANQASAEVIGLLLLHHPPANLWRVEMGGYLPIHLTAQWGVRSPDVIDVLIQSNKTLACARDHEGLTPFEVAMYAEDYDYKQDVIDILRAHYEEEVMNEGDDSTISTRASNFVGAKKKRRPSAILLNQLDDMRDEAEKLNSKKLFVKESAERQIELEWEAINLTISQMKNQHQTTGKFPKRHLEMSSPDNDSKSKSSKTSSVDPVESARRATCTDEEASDADPLGKLPMPVSSSENVLATDIQKEARLGQDSGVSYDIPDNLFESQSYDPNDISYSASLSTTLNDDNEDEDEDESGENNEHNEKAESNLKEPRRSSKNIEPAIKKTQEDANDADKNEESKGTSEEKNNINKTVSRDSKGSTTSWLMQWRRLARRNRDPAPPKTAHIDMTDELNSTHIEKDFNAKKIKSLLESEPRLPEIEDLSQESEGVDTVSTQSISSLATHERLSKIKKENELMELEYAAQIRRSDAYSSKIKVAEIAVKNLATEIRKLMICEKETMRKMQILQDDMKVTTAVRRAHLKSMVADMEDDEIDISRTVGKSSGVLKKQRKTLDFMEEIIQDLK